MKRLIISLICKKLGVKTRELFRFTNQKKKDIYYFSSTELRKFEPGSDDSVLSDVGLNWLLSDECKVTKNIF